MAVQDVYGREGPDLVQQGRSKDVNFCRPIKKCGHQGGGKPVNRKNTEAAANIVALLKQQGADYVSRGQIDGPRIFIVPKKAHASIMGFKPANRKKHGGRSGD
jgi:hypothetical protein